MKSWFCFDKNMKKIIIFDFNRTIYNPELFRLMPKAKFVLRTLLRRGFRLYLVSCGGQSRKQTIEELKIKKYFYRIIISPRKNKKIFKQIIEESFANRRLSFVVGDRVKKEIRFGNKLNLKTIWLRKGEFASELARKNIERPTYIINSLADVLKIIPKK